MQTNFPLWLSCLINNIAQIGKYVPGKIWSYVGRYYIGRDYNLTKKTAVVSIANEFVFFITAGFIISIPALLPYIHNIWLRYTYGVLCILILVFYQTVISLALNIYKKLKKVDIKIPKLSRRVIAYYMLLYLLLWSFGGFSFYLLAISLHLSNWNLISFVNYNALFAASYVISYIAFFAPGGIGIREYIQDAYLPIIGITNYQSALLAIFARIISTFADVILYLISILVLRKWSKINRSNRN